MKNKFTIHSIDNFNRVVLVRAGNASARISKSDVSGELSFLKLSGKWSLVENDVIRFTASGRKLSAGGKSIILTGELERAGGGSVVFRFREGSSPVSITGRTFQLKGHWRADDNNRLKFNVARASGRYDILRFQGAWQMGRENEIIYKLRRTELKRSSRSVSALVFRGEWELFSKKIVLRVEGSTDSFFAFKAELSPSRLSSRGNRIIYRVGIKYKRRKRWESIVETVSVYGHWEPVRGKRIGFAVDVPRGTSTVYFKISGAVFRGTSLTLYLKDIRGAEFGAGLKLTRKLRGDISLTLEAESSGKGFSVLGGMRMKI